MKNEFGRNTWGRKGVGDILGFRLTSLYAWITLMGLKAATLIAIIGLTISFLMLLVQHFELVEFDWSANASDEGIPGRTFNLILNLSLFAPLINFFVSLYRNQK